MSRFEKLKIPAVIVGISFCQGLQYTVSPVLNQISEHFSGVNISLVQMLITVPALLSMVVALVSGKLVTKVTKKHLLLFGSFVCGITGLIPLLADNFLLLFLSRTFFGIGLGLATTLNTVIVADFYEGRKRVAMMGLQGASVGGGMLIETTLSGMVGAVGFTNVYFIHIIAFISMVLIALLLPDRGKVVETQAVHIQLNGRVFVLALLGLLEFAFLISFSTNIAMHISGALAGSSSVSGVLTGTFSAVMVICGLTLHWIYRVTGKFTIGAGMLSFSIGAFLLVLFPDNFPMLILAAVFCGISQGIFVPQAMCEVADAVNPASTAMASAVFTCGMCLGQSISPYLLNSLSRSFMGSVTTSHVYLIGAIAMLLISLAVIFVSKAKNKKPDKTGGL